MHGAYRIRAYMEMTMRNLSTGPNRVFAMLLLFMLTLAGGARAVVADGDSGCERDGGDLF